MSRFSRSVIDATHSLFVVEATDRPQRFVFVDERSGDVLTFSVTCVRGGASVTLAPDGTPVILELSPGRSPRRVGAEGVSAIGIRDGGTRLSLRAGGVEYTATIQANGGVEIWTEAERTPIVLAPNFVASGPLMYDVWALNRTPTHPIACRVIVEVLVTRRLLLESAHGPTVPLD